MAKNEAIQWLRVCSKDPASPARVTRADLGMLTGQDSAALVAIDGCWQLYARADAQGAASALNAIRALLSAMQPKCRFLARELIAKSLDWHDRDRLWGQL